MAQAQMSDETDGDLTSYLRATYESVLKSIDAPSALVLDFGAGRLAETVRRAADRSVDPLMPGRAAHRWLTAHIGPIDDALRRAAVAALALGLRPDPLAFPMGVLELYPAAHMRLARFLIGAHAYDGELFAKDVAFAAGLAAPAGALAIAVPSLHAPRLSPSRAIRAAGAFRRQWTAQGAREAARWLATWRLNPWVELHVDKRNLGEFNAAGFQRCYHRIADLLMLRPDLAGVYGASWLYQPELSSISPNLAFPRETAEAGGGRLVRLRADPVQTAFALARSPTRKQLFLKGDYQPVCYGMFWTRDALLDWSRSKRATAAR